MHSTAFLDLKSRLEGRTPQSRHQAVPLQMPAYLKLPETRLTEGRGAAVLGHYLVRNFKSHFGWDLLNRAYIKPAGSLACSQHKIYKFSYFFKIYSLPLPPYLPPSLCLSLPLPPSLFPPLWRRHASG